MPASNSIFKTPELEKQYMALYEVVLTKWNVPMESLDITTRYGITHINTCGSNSNPPMILLPGFGANSAMWFPNIASLSSEFQVYAIDINGQPGKSIPSQKLTAMNNADWLADVLDALRLGKIFIAGISLGGWLVLNFVLHKPERVNRVVLLDPAASLEKMSTPFLQRSFMPIMIHPTRSNLVKYFRWMTQGYDVDPDWGELMLQGILNIRPQPPIRPEVFTDSELRSVKVPVLVLIGEHSVIYHPRRAYQRALNLFPNVQAEIIPAASHALNFQKADYVNARILKFCQNLY